MRGAARSTVTLAAALAALALLGYTSLRGSAPPPAPATDDVRAELARLERRVDALTRALALARAAPPATAHTAPPIAAPAGAVAPDGADDDDPGPALRFRAFDAPAGLTVTADGAAISVRNHDPALAGQLVPITAERDDGAREVLTVLVPEPS